MAKLMVDGMEVGGTFTSGESGSTNASDHIYDNTNSENITSETVQGAIDELDEVLSTVNNNLMDYSLLDGVDVITYIDDLPKGTYSLTSLATCTNTPVIATCILLVQKYSDTNINIIATVSNSDKYAMYFKSKIAGNWLEWRELATLNNLNVKVGSFDESTATLYLVPVE